MPLILVAGTVANPPKAEHFPKRGHPRCEVNIRVETHATAAVFRIVGFEECVDELAMLLPGDSIAVQGTLQLESSELAGFFVVATQVMALRRRSPNRFAAAVEAGRCE